MVDDDREVLVVNRKFFEHNNCKVCICSDARLALNTAKGFKPDCILLDVLMPAIDGFQLCREFRAFTNIPIIFLSGKVSEDDKLKGFSYGADDYIVKPYSLKELYIRIIANIRRHRILTKESSNTIHICGLTISETNHKVLYDNSIIPLSNQEFELLLYLVKHPDETIYYETLGQQIWDSYADTDRRAVMVVMSRLRKKLNMYCHNDAIIEFE